MDCIQILIEAGASTKRAKDMAPGLADAMKRRGYIVEKEKPKKKKKKVLESRDIMEPKNTYE